MRYINPVKLHRVAYWFHSRRVPMVGSFLSFLGRYLHQCDIPPDVQIGNNVQFKHGGFGVVLNPSTIIHDDVILMPFVVVGVSVSAGGNVGELSSVTIEKGVLLGAGCKIIAKGKLTIGEGAAVGANCVVTKDVAPGDTVVGIPARSLKRKETLIT